jgi:hypothetical protein
MRKLLLILVAIITASTCSVITAKPMNMDNIFASIQGKSLSGNIVISEPNLEGIVYISYTGYENVTIIVTVNDEEVDFENGRIQLNAGQSTITVIVTASGYNTKTKTFQVEWYPQDDPHQSGYWIVFISNEEKEIWYELFALPDGNYYNMIDCPKAIYGDIARFYYMIDGCPYGAPDDMVEVFLQDYLYNPLVAYPSGSPYYYFIHTGYGNMIGIYHHYNDFGELSAYCCYVNQYYEINPPGDVNQDDIVNIHDVSDLIEMLLYGSYWDSPDVNKDGVVNIEDLAKLIDILLHQS